MPTYFLAVIFYLAPETINGLNAYQLPSNEQFIKLGFRENLLLLIFISTFLMPASLIYYLYKIKILPSLKMEVLSTRKIPYLITFLLYLFFGFFVKARLPLLKEIPVSIFSIATCLFIVFLLSFYWKISAHAMGMGGTLGVFIGFYIKFGADQLFIPILVTIILSGLIMTARLQLKAHDFYQIIAGFLVGLAISISSIILFL